VKAAFTKENDVFAENNLNTLTPSSTSQIAIVSPHQMLQVWQPVLVSPWRKTIAPSNRDLLPLKEYED